MPREDNVICAGCGRPVAKYESPRHSGDRVVEIRVGKLLQSQVSDGKRKPGRPRRDAEKFKAESLWGVMHFDCFVRCVESRDDVFKLLSTFTGGFE